MNKKKVPVWSGTASPMAFGSSAFGAPSLATFSSLASSLSYISEPPDFSGISDPSTVVLFKNLLKKDENTKAKALEDLLAKAEKLEDIEEPVIATWVRLYPRLSVDISRRVRLLSHTLLGTICQKSGRRIAKYMPKIVGSWLCGLYDSDRSVSRTTSDSLVGVFKAEEKLRSLWTVYETTILDYCNQVVTNEKVHTLSDERSVSADDAEAKFARVMATSIMAVTHLISMKSAEKLQQNNDSYTEFLQSKALWELASHSDPYLRKAAYRILQAALDKRPAWISTNLERIATAVILKGLAQSQTGSAEAYLDALVAITSTLPESWSRTKGSKSPFTRLAAFVEKGSQLAQPMFWSKLAELFGLLPDDFVVGDWKSAISCPRAMRKAVDAPEPRSHLPGAWDCYLGLCYRLVELQQSTPGLEVFTLKDNVLPVFMRYLDTHMLGGDAVCANAILKLRSYSRDTVKIFMDEVWADVEMRTADAMTRESELSKMRMYGEGWVNLTARVFNTLTKDDPMHTVIRQSCRNVLSAVIGSVTSKSDGAVAVLEQHFNSQYSAVLEDPEVRRQVTNFFDKGILELVESAAIESLLRCFVIYGCSVEDLNYYQEQWRRVINGLLLSSADAKTKERTIQLLINLSSEYLSGRIQPCAELDGYVLNKLKKSSQGDGSCKLLGAVMSSGGGAISREIVQRVFQGVIGSLVSDSADTSEQVRDRLSALLQGNQEDLVMFTASVEHNGFLAKLLTYAEPTLWSDPDVHESANKILQVILRPSPKRRPQSVVSLADVICDQVQHPNKDDLSVEYLVGRTVVLLSNDMPSEISERFLFSESEWETAMQPLFRDPPKPSIAVTNPLGGAQFLVEKEGDGGSNSSTVLHDSQGYSQALRMAMFVLKLLRDPSQPVLGHVMNVANRATITVRLCGVQELLKDNISMLGANAISKPVDPPMESEVSKFLEGSQQWALEGFKLSDGTLATQVFQNLAKLSEGSSVGAFYAARSLASLGSVLEDACPSFMNHGASWLESCEVRKTPETIRITAMLVGFGGLMKQPVKEKMANALVDGILGVSAKSATTEAAPKLVLLNAVLPVPEETAIPIPARRVILLTKHLLDWFDDKNEEAQISSHLISEVAKTLARLLPAVGTMYGEHWELSFRFIKDIWMGCNVMAEEDIPMLLSTLKLSQVIRSLLPLENDDLVDAWDGSREELMKTLIEMSKVRIPDTNHQPRNMCYIHLARQLRDVDASLIEDHESIISSLSTISRPLQQAAFDILHRAIPAKQEQISINAAISPEAAAGIHLPLELLSMIIDVPSFPSDVSELSEDFLLSIRGYLFSWVLIYDHFDNASFKVRSIYTEALKDGSYIPSLLSLIFNLLLPSSGRPYDASKIDITMYTPSPSTDTLPDLPHLCTHLYYLTLHHTPSLPKSWFLSHTNRSVTTALESFTERYLSPLLIAHELNAVAENNPSTDNLTIRISKSAREVTATYPIDDQAMDIVVRLPSAYPLQSVSIQGLRRVGLDEKHFQRLILASQAVVNFQSGSIVDALSMFRKNVSLHFDGVAECAICYSILAVTPDRSLPNRACGTCRNKFHSTCLLKWFKTSNSSSCPLCRTSFSFYS